MGFMDASQIGSKSRHVSFDASLKKPRALSWPMTNSGTGGIGIRFGTRDDVAKVVKIHEGAFGTRRMTQLGSWFLKQYYRRVISSRDGMLLVGEGATGITGFAAGFMHPERFYRGMILKSWVFALPLCSAVISRPSLLVSIAYSIGRVLRSTPRGNLPDRCELASIAVEPDKAGKGVGGALVRAFVHEAWKRGANAVVLTTDAEGNDAVNRFYLNLGFDVQRTFRQYGGPLTNEYVRYSPQRNAA